MNLNDFNLLFIADGPLDRPLLHSQGLPLLRELSSMGVKCFIQSFETSVDVIDSNLGKELIKQGIVWLPVVISKSMNSFQRIEMILKGYLESERICRNNSIHVVHCRSYRPGFIGSTLKFRLGVGFLFDMRGFLIDEQIILGRLKPKGFFYELLRKLEKWCLISADVIVTTSPQFSKRLLDIPYMTGSKKVDIVEAIPNCVDTSRFYYSDILRKKNKAVFNWEGKTILVFSGEASSWESFDSVISFYKAFKTIIPSAYLLFLVYGSPQALGILKQKIISNGIDEGDYSLITAPPNEMPNYLVACDLGIVLRNENPFTQEIASPIKFAEFLACGLPVVINHGVGDTSTIINKYQVGVVIENEIPEQIVKGADIIADLILNDPELPARCQKAAEKELSLNYSVKEYLKVYEKIINGSNLRE